MTEINRLEVDEFWADSTVIEAGDYVFVGYCMGNEGKSIQEQIHGAIDTLEKLSHQILSVRVLDFR